MEKQSSLIWYNWHMFNKLFREYKGLRRENYILFFGRLMTNLGAMIWPVLTMILDQKLGMSAEKIAGYLVVFVLIGLPVSMIGGKIADRFDKKMNIVYCDIVSIVLLIVCSFIRLSLWSIILMAVAALAQLMESASYDSLVADITPAADRERAYSLNYLGANIGLILSPTIAGFLFANYLWLSFFLSGLGIASSTILIFFKIHNIKPVRESTHYEVRRDGESSLRVLLDNKVMLFYLIAISLMGAAYNQLNYLIPLDMGAEHGATGAAIFGTMTSTNCIEVVIFMPLITAWFRRLSETVKTFIGGVLIVAGLLMFRSLLGTVPMYYAAMTVFTLGEVFYTLPRSPYISNRTPASHRGRINSIQVIMSGAASAVTQLIAGKLYDGMGSWPAWTFVLAVGTLACVLSMLIIPLDKKAYPKIGGKNR